MRYVRTDFRYFRGYFWGLGGESGAKAQGNRRSFSRRGNRTEDFAEASDFHVPRGIPWQGAAATPDGNHAGQRNN